MLKKRFFKTKQECEVTFEVAPEGANNVKLLCEANEWEPVAMKRSAKSFKAKVRLPKNQEFEFRYLVDEQHWLNDEAADGYRPNEHGTDNSIVSTIEA